MLNTQGTVRWQRSDPGFLMKGSLSALSLYFSSQSSRPRLCFISCLCLGHRQTEVFKPPCFILNWGGKSDIWNKYFVPSCWVISPESIRQLPGCTVFLSPALGFSVETKAYHGKPHNSPYGVSDRKVNNIEPEPEGISWCTSRRPESEGWKGGWRADHPAGVKKIRLCTQFDPCPGSHRALCKSVCSICQNNITADHNPVVNTFLRMKRQTRFAKDNVYYRVHNPRAIYCQECSEKNRAEIRNGKNKCTCLATLNSTWRCNWCHNKGFQRLKAEVNAASKRLYNTHRHRVGKKGNRKHNKYGLVVKAKPQRAWRVCPTPGCGMQLWLNNARKVYQNDQVPYHPRSTMMCLGWNEIGVPRLCNNCRGWGCRGGALIQFGWDFWKPRKAGFLDLFRSTGRELWNRGWA